MSLTPFQIYKIARQQGINVGLERVERSPKYKEFKKNIREGIENQIMVLVNNSNLVDTLTMLAKADNPLLSQVGLFMAYAAVENDWKNIIPAYLVWAGEQGGQNFLDKVEIDAVFGLQNKKFISYFNDRSKLVIKSVDNTTKKWIAEIIQESKQSGLSTSQIIDKMVTEIPGFTKIRAERIALTETANAMSLVEIESAKKMGFTEMIWRTSRDERVCPICGPLEGRRKKFDEVFDGIYNRPPAHVSCRCDLEEVIPDTWQKPTSIWLGA